MCLVVLKPPSYKKLIHQKLASNLSWFREITKEEFSLFQKATPRSHTADKMVVLEAMGFYWPCQWLLVHASDAYVTQWKCSCMRLALELALTLTSYKIINAGEINQTRSIFTSLEIEISFFYIKVHLNITL